MFIQVIDGHVTADEELRQCLDQWVQDLSPKAIGWQGTTAGVTEDGLAVVMVRFDSEQSARANSARPEQHEWWMETSKLFAGDVHFRDCAKSWTYLRGPAADAGFVQLMRGYTEHLGRMRELDEKVTPLMPELRPDIVGGLVALHGDGYFTAVNYFTTETEARRGERRTLPAHVQELIDEEMALVEELTYLDLHEPWHYSRQ